MGMQTNKAKKKIIYELAYTRDCTLVIQQEWLRALEAEYKRLGGKRTEPIGIDYYKNSVTQVWQNKAKLISLIKGLRVESKKREKYLLSRLKNYEKALPTLARYWKKGKANTIVELQKFIALIKKIMPQDMLLCLLADETGVSPIVLKECQRLRSKDIFFSQSDLFIRNSLAQIYPRLGKCVVTINQGEVSKPLSRNEYQRRFLESTHVFGEVPRYSSLQRYVKQKQLYSFVQPKGTRTSLGAVKGVVAYPGDATGKTRVVRSNFDAARVKSGEIIIAAMTTPVMVPAMKRAAAIITDEGGSLCHAAVIAREFKIPCIVGTRVATRVFKSGDIIHINSAKGTVIKVK